MPVASAAAACPLLLAIPRYCLLLVAYFYNTSAPLQGTEYKPLPGVIKPPLLLKFQIFLENSFGISYVKFWSLCTPPMVGRF